MRISDWSSDVCSSDLDQNGRRHRHDGEQGDQPAVQARSRPALLALDPQDGESPGDERRQAQADHQVGQQQQQNMARSEEHTSELQSLMRISYAVFCLKTKKNTTDKKSHARICTNYK